jgi:hypothetical protein
VFVGAAAASQFPPFANLLSGVCFTTVFFQQAATRVASSRAALCLKTAGRLGEF